jgi:hypothetical protein
VADNNGSGPRLVPSAAPIFGQQLDILANVDPLQFPLGLEVSFTVPGKLAPEATMMLKPGAMVAMLPQPVAEHLRAELKKAFAKQRAAAGPGDVNAPGT